MRDKSGREREMAIRPQIEAKKSTKATWREQR